MLNIVISLVLFALAGAMSTVPLSVTILILLSPSPRRGALPFLIGSLAGSMVLVGLSAVGLQFLPVKPRQKDELVAQLAIVTGALLICYSAYLFVSKSRRENATLDKMKSRFHSARPWEFALLGLGLNLRPKAILLAVTAGALISARELLSASEVDCTECPKPSAQPSVEGSFTGRPDVRPSSLARRLPS